MKLAGSTAALLAIALAVLPSACGSDPGDPSDADGGQCTGGNCDLPTDPSERSCALRRSDAFNPNQKSFTQSALRWSCADVDGVTGIHRGQEYCEYFAIVKLPATATEPQIVGRLIRHDGDGGDPTYDTTPIALDLDSEAISELEADPSAVVGQCVFTSWNEDVQAPPPACTPGPCPTVLDVPVNTANFQMRLTQNSAEAAMYLVEDCMCAHHEFASGMCTSPQPFEGDPDNPEDVLHDDFTRGCMLTAELNRTEFRKSDTTMCSAALRMAECGCQVDPGVGGDFPDVISPAARRGFPLGTWSGASELPTGCQFVALGDDSQTVVTCDLSAGDVLSRSTDLKQLCREKYGPNVVVHVPIAPDAIDCDPAAAASPYGASCSATPWVVAGKSSEQ